MEPHSCAILKKSVSGFEPMPMNAQCLAVKWNSSCLCDVFAGSCVLYR